MVDLAVNVRPAAPPGWLQEVLRDRVADLARYPDQTAALETIARRHDRAPDEVLITAGAAEAFVLIARTLHAEHAVVVHPQFTEPEAALLAAGRPVDHVVLDPADGFALDPARIPASADLVIVGNPTNPTSILHRADVLRRIARSGRVLVVDEAFMDAVPGESESLAAASDVPGLLVVRSLTKTWGLAGLRIGYVLGERAQLRRMQLGQPLWPVSTLALTAVQACLGEGALRDVHRSAAQISADRDYLQSRLDELRVVRSYGKAQGPFVLLNVPDGRHVHTMLRDRGIAVRRADTFPGLGPDWLRVAIKDRPITDLFVDSLAEILIGASAVPEKAGR